MSSRRRKKTRTVLTRFVVIAAALVTVAAAALVVKLHGRPTAANPGGAAIGRRPPPAPDLPRRLHARGTSVLRRGPGLHRGHRVRPGVIVYYSGWMESFQVRFAEMAARHHAAPLVQIDPTGISLTAIAAGRYDPHLRSYADAVRAFGGRVIISFGHEMNGNW